MTRSVLWTSADERFEDGLWRRRALIPAAALKNLQWRRVTRAEFDAHLARPDLAVIDAMAEDAPTLATRLTAMRIPIVVDATRWLADDPDPTPEAWADLETLQSSACAIIAPDLAGQARLAIRGFTPVHVVEDAVETPVSVRLAAQTARMNWTADATAPGADAATVWFAQPGDADEAELEALIAAAESAAAAGRNLLLLAPKDTLNILRARLPNSAALDWSLAGQFAALAAATDVLLPGPDTASRRRRAATAERMGVPVVGQTDASPLNLAASPSVDAARAWLDVLNAALSARRAASPPIRPMRLLVFLDLIQDIELALPIAAAATTRGDVDVTVVMTRWLTEQSPSAAGRFKALGLRPQIIERDAASNGKLPRLDGIDAVLTPVATNLNAHRRADALVQRAKVLGIPTFSLQHGLENVGLSYADQIHTKAVEVTTDHLFIWFPPDFWPVASPALRRKFISVGTIKTVPEPGAVLPLPDVDAPVVSVFENLHWHRYSDSFRQRFIDDLYATAARSPTCLFVLKPHHAGRWTSKQTIASPPENLIIIDPQDAAWEPFTAPWIIERSRLVITTPSTVALDGAMAGKPVAVVGYDLDLPLYEPLPVLRSTHDWQSTVDNLDHNDSVLGKAFLHRTILSSGAAPNLLDAIIDRTHERL